jgi:hypothetical protein
VYNLSLLGEAPAGRQQQPSKGDGLPKAGVRSEDSIAAVYSEEKTPVPCSSDGSATPAVLSTAFEATCCGHLPHIALPLTLEHGPCLAAGSGIAEDQAVVGLVRPRH